MKVIVPKNTDLPAHGSVTFAASEGKVPETIKLYAGDQAQVKKNQEIGCAFLSVGGIPPMPRGAPPVDVTFDIDVRAASRRMPGEGLRVCYRPRLF